MNLHDYLFGPLNKDWCAYFYFLSIIWYVTFVISVISIVFYLFTKKVDTKVLFGMLLYTITVFIMYFEKRILNGMCVNSSASAAATITK
jgi:hypothetical protein